MLGSSGLNACLFIGGDHKVVIAKWFAVQTSSVQVQYTTGLEFELRISGKDPASMTPGPQGVLGEPSPALSRR